MTSPHHQTTTIYFKTIFEPYPNPQNSRIGLKKKDKTPKNALILTGLSWQQPRSFKALNNFSIENFKPVSVSSSLQMSACHTLLYIHATNSTEWLSTRQKNLRNLASKDKRYIRQRCIPGAWQCLSSYVSISYHMTSPHHQTTTTHK